VRRIDPLALRKSKRCDETADRVVFDTRIGDFVAA
jgi:hypothetical protein